jgi:hypothetical protein
MSTAEALDQVAFHPSILKDRNTSANLIRIILVTPAIRRRRRRRRLVSRRTIIPSSLLSLVFLLVLVVCSSLVVCASLVVCSSLVFAVPMFLAKEGSDGGEDQDDEGAAAVL